MGNSQLPYLSSIKKKMRKEYGDDEEYDEANLRKDAQLQFYVSPEANKLVHKKAQDGDEVSHNITMTGNDILVSKKKRSESPFSQKSTEPEREARIQQESPYRQSSKKKRHRSSVNNSTLRIAELLDQV